MRKTFLCLFVALMAMTANLKAQTIVFTDGFESGNLSKWTQENGVDSKSAPTTLWAVESENLSYPETAFQGTHRAYLRNTTGETQGYVTRLVTPEMDLTDVFQPIVRFYYANPKWTADRDTLRLLYRTGPKAAWKELAVFGDAKKDWTFVEMELPEYGSNKYQIAFEGKDNLGRGIVLDSIVVRSQPECTTPHDFVVTNKGYGNVNLAWEASWDANEFEVIISLEKLDPDTVENVADSLIIYHSMVDGHQHYFDMQSLVSGQYYYAYLRSHCDNEISYWNSKDPHYDGDYRFRVKATKNVPYSYGFNLPYKESRVERDLEWTWGNNVDNFVPFINVFQKEVEDLAKYSNDTTRCVVFAGKANVMYTIPAGKYVYLATPALADSLSQNFALNQCQVRFWSTVYTYTGNLYAHSIIVGVMTDPEDITTFEPMDTVSVYGSSQFVESIVDLSSYQGEGAFVAFKSDFDKQNLIYIDNVTIEYKTHATQKVTKISANPRDTYAEIAWEGNAPQYNVIITNEKVANPSKATTAQVVVSTQVTTNSYKCEALEPDHSWNRPYYVYVQSVYADTVAAWSNAYPFVTIATKKDMPYSFDFDGTDASSYYTFEGSTTRYPSNIGIFSNNPDLPQMKNGSGRNGSYALTQTKSAGNDTWITLPMIDSIPGAQIKFYLSGSTTPAQASASVGVMTNPMDFSTFVPVADFKVATTGYTLCYANFENYPEKEGVIAIAWKDFEDGKNKSIINYIDEITVEKIATCLPPMNIEVDVVESDTATLTWNASDDTAWEFVLASKALTESQRNQPLSVIAVTEGVLSVDTLEWSDLLSRPTFGIDSLDSNSEFYAYIRTMCGETDRSWWTEIYFKTPCPKFAIPFKEDFESYEATAYPHGGMGCWQTKECGTSTTYPKIMTPTSGAVSGKQLELWSSGTTYRNVAILPAVDADLSTLVLSFDARSYGTTTKSVLYVGSMGDIEDATSFVAIDTIYMDGGNEFTQVRIDLADYTLAYNNIAITSGLASTLEMNSDTYIDNVSLKPNNCIEAWDIQATDIQANSIDIAWQGKSADDKWKVKVMQGKVPIVKDSLVTGKTFHVEGLAPMQAYTFSIQVQCSDSAWAEAIFRTPCSKLDPTKPNKEDFESVKDATTSYKATSQIPCWTVGNGNPKAATTYIPFVYKSTTYSSSGNNTYRAYGYKTSSADNTPAYIATPEIDCQSMSELAVTFNMYATTSYWWICGVMSDPDSLGTFVALDSVKGTGTSVQYTYDLSEYASKIPADAKYFAWRGRYGVTDYLYLDDVSIIKVTCPLPKPSVSGIKSSYATIASGLRSTENSWIALVTTKKFEDEELAYMDVDSLGNDSQAIAKKIVVFYDTISTRSKVVTGLEEKTTYYVAIATVCDGEISAWKQTSFTTPCKALTPEAMGTITFSKKDGYVSGTTASRYMPCWTVGNMSGNAGATSSYIPYIYTTAAYLFGTQKDSVLCVYSYAPTSSTATKYNGAYAIMPELEVNDISNYQVNFYARAYSTNTYGDKLIVGVVTDPGDLNTFVAVDTVRLNHAAYEPFSISFEDYEGDYLGDKGRYIMFTNECTGSVTSNYSFVASISVAALPACRPVSKFIIDSIAEDAAVVSWKANGNKYRILLADEQVDDAQKATYTKWLIDSIVNHTDSVLITGLKYASQYYLYAQNICSATDSSAISMSYALLNTLCPENGFAVPYKENFESFSTGAYEHEVGCWLTADYSTGTGYPKILKPTSGAQDGNMLELYSTTSTYRNMAMMPKIQGNLSDYMLSFDARSFGTSGKSILYIGTMSDINDSTTFVPFDTLYMTQGNEFYHLDLTLADYNLVHDHIAFSSGYKPTLENNANSDLYIDNVKIGMPPSCYAPLIEVIERTISTMDVKVTPAKDGNSHWELAVVPDSIYTAKNFDLVAYLDTTASAIHDMIDDIITVTDLEAGTVYQLFARTLCGGEDGISSWSDKPTRVRTRYYYKDSYSFGFERSEGEDLYIGQSSTATYYMHPALEYGYSGGTATTSYTSYWPYLRENSSETAIYAYGPADLSLGKGVLRWNATASYWGQYVIFPSVDKAQDRSFEFKARAGYGLYVKASDTMAVSTPADYIIEVGTIDKNKGIETYKPLASMTKKALDKTKMTAENDWLWTSYTLDLDSATIADKQIVLYNPKPQGSVYLHVDNVALKEKKGFGLVSINKVKVKATEATVIWDSIDGPWNLYILKANGDTIQKYLNISDATSQQVTGLAPQSSYQALLVGANAPAGTKFEVKSTKGFRTPCLPIEPDAKGEFFWSFDDPNETEPNDILAGAATDTAYLKPNCFTVGTNYTSSYSNGYQWLWQSKGHDYYSTLGNWSTTYAHREIGYGDSFGSLRIYTTSSYVSATVKTWIAMPELHCDLDTMMVEFWGRCLANHDDTYGTVADRGKVISNTYLGSSYSRSMVIGTLTDPNDFSTLQVIDTVTYTYTQSEITGTTFVKDDKSGNRFWQKMQVPLTGAKGKYIVFFQPAYGLFFIDNLCVKRIGDNIFPPYAPKTGEVTKTTAEFTWKVKQPSLPSIVVVANQAGDSIIKRDTVLTAEGDSVYYKAEGLEPSSAYTWYAYQIRGNDSTTTTAHLTFYTECQEYITPDYTTGFEDAEGWEILPKQTAATYKKNLCWTYENSLTAAVSTNIYNQTSTATAGYGHSGKNGLRMYASSTVQPYAALPAMDIAAYDTLQVNFWMRPGYHNPTTGKISSQYTTGSSAATKEYYYSRSIIVGTMTDPNDVATFVPIDTINYKGILKTTDLANEANEYLFEKKKVALRGATGQHVAFMTTLNMKGQENASTTEYMWLDDISFSLRQDCKDPYDLSVSEISAHHAQLNWVGEAEKYYVQVNTDINYPDSTMIYSDTVSAQSFVVTGLRDTTEYVWHVKAICGEDLGESDYSQNASFVSAHVPYFAENFEDANLPSDWTFGTNYYMDVLDSTDVEISGSNSTSYGFRRVTTNYGIEGPHYAVVMYSSSTETTTTYDHYWMITPVVYLSDTTVTHMTVDLALTASNNTTPSAGVAAEANMANDFVFAIAVSDDGGKTWKKENVLAVWNNMMPAGSQLRDLPHEAKTYRFDLAKYAGKDVRVAFYRDATSYLGGVTCAVHIGNIRFIDYQNFAAAAEACQFEDIEENGFFIDGDKAPAGEARYMRLKPASDEKAREGAIDSVYTLDVKYNPVPEAIIMDTICEGDTYTNYDFSGKTQTGVYTRKTSPVHACDSITRLYLYVRPREYTALSDSICQGQKYNFHGKLIYTSGLYTDTIPSSHGCDSIVTLDLKVVSEFKSEFSDAVCAGQSYYWAAAGKTYTEAGDYTETLKTAGGCDSVVTLHLSYNKIYIEKVTVAICEGATYEFAGEKLDKAGVYTHTFESAQGCDSTVTLTLEISNIYRDTIKAEINEGETYSFYDVEYDVEGTYNIMRPGVDGDCDSLRVLVLTVTPVQAIENVNTYGELVLRPTILNAGETVRADYHFTKADLANLKVEVYDIVGRSVEAKTYDHQPIIIDAFPIAGVYTVRITTGTGLNLVGRVVVR